MVRRTAGREGQHQIGSCDVPSAYCLELGCTVTEDFGTLPTAAAIVVRTDASPHIGQVERVSLGRRMDVNSTDCGHSSNLHSHVTARLDTTWLSSLHCRVVKPFTLEISMACRLDD
jgi:hypothetical protein